MTNKKQSKEKPQRDLTSVKRAGFLIMFSGSIAVSAYLGILVATPDTGQYVLAGFSAVNAVYFFTKTIN
jgi:hypothetical protein